MGRVKGGGAACSYCQSGAEFMVASEAAGGQQETSLACKAHLGVAVAKMADRTGTASATVHVIAAARQMIDGEQELVDHVAEHVRRVGAHSRDDEAAHALEDQLYAAVLALVAQGAPHPALLAATALQTRNYHFERQTS